VSRIFLWVVHADVMIVNIFRYLHTPYSEMAASLLLFCLHGNWPSLPGQHVQKTKEL